MDPAGMVARTGARLERGRDHAEALMGDRFEIRRDSGQTVWSEETGKNTRAWEVIAVTRGKTQRSRVTETDRAGVETSVVRPELHLPIDTPAIPEGSVAKCVAVGPHSDPRGLGRCWRIGDDMTKTWATARRLVVEEVAQPWA